MNKNNKSKNNNKKKAEKHSETQLARHNAKIKIKRYKPPIRVYFISVYSSIP